MVYSGLEPERQVELGSANVPAAVTTIKYHCDQVRRNWLNFFLFKIIAKILF